MSSLLVTSSSSTSSGSPEPRRRDRSVSRGRDRSRSARPRRPRRVRVSATANAIERGSSTPVMSSFLPSSSMRGPRVESGQRRGRGPTTTAMATPPSWDSEQASRLGSPWRYSSGAPEAARADLDGVERQPQVAERLAGGLLGGETGGEARPCDLASRGRRRRGRRRPLAVGEHPVEETSRRSMTARQPGDVDDVAARAIAGPVDAVTARPPRRREVVGRLGAGRGRRGVAAARSLNWRRDRGVALAAASSGGPNRTVTRPAERPSASRRSATPRRCRPRRSGRPGPARRPPAGRAPLRSRWTRPSRLREPSG